MKRQRGFTLFETIIVLVLVGTAAVGLIAMQGSLFKNRTAIDDMQVRVGLMQGCAEQVLAIRRYAGDGYAAVDTTLPAFASCGGLSAFGSFAVPRVDITDPYTGPACPANGICKTVSISLDDMTPLTLMLVDQ
jgi:prepilin-type N-terminal cleavage/methylation domain-containing protein